jgi:hypothetical protein
MLDFLNKYGKNIIYSQNSEEGLLIECLRRMDITEGNCVEIGGHDGKWCSNTAYLIDQGWKGKFVEADFDLWQKSCENWKHNDKVRCRCSFVTNENVNAFITTDTDVLSIDTDGYDIDIFRAMTVKPKIVIVEINSGYAPHERVQNKKEGASYLPMLELGIEKGYFLLCHTGNLVFILNKYRHLFPEIEGDGLYNSEKYFKTDWLKMVHA